MASIGAKLTDVDASRVVGPRCCGSPPGQVPRRRSRRRRRHLRVIAGVTYFVTLPGRDWLGVPPTCKATCNRNWILFFDMCRNFAPLALMPGQSDSLHPTEWRETGAGRTPPGIQVFEVLRLMGRCRAGREQLKRFYRLLSENSSSQGHNLALTVLFVPSSLDSGGA